LNEIVVLTADEMALFPANEHLKQTKLKMIKKLRIRDSVMKSRKAALEHSEKEKKKIQTLLDLRTQEIAELTAKLDAISKIQPDADF